MSSKSLKLFDPNYRNDSFEDRICDDLAKDILQFLPLKHKFKLECVSKQFQRTVFQRQHKLILMEIFKSRSSEERRLFRLGKVLQKLPNIRCLDATNYFFVKEYFTLNEREIILIIENCNNLVEFFSDLIVTQTTRQRFVEKFGKSLLSFTENIGFHENIEKSFPNIKELKIQPYVWNHKTLRLFYKRFANLKKVSIPSLNFVKSKDHSKAFQSFFKNNTQLTHLRVLLPPFYESYDTNYDFIFTQISNLNDLIELKLEIVRQIPAHLLISALKRMQLKCHRLKSLSIMNVKVRNRSQIIEILTLLKSFKAFKRLDIGFVADFFIDNNDFHQPFISCFEGFHLLTHLNLRLSLISFPKVLEDIDKYLPNLQLLYFRGHEKANDDWISSLSQLKKLDKLSLSCEGGFKGYFHNLIYGNI